MSPTCDGYTGRPSRSHNLTKGMAGCLITGSRGGEAEEAFGVERMVTDDASPDVETGVVDVDAEREPCGVEG